MEVEKGLFDSSVDATYVITLEGNGRYERVVEQLKKYHPTRVLYIMTNRGYKRCKKDLEKDLPRYDLTDAFINVFKHAKAEQYRNILVLEDDFIFSDRILEPDVGGRVNQFVSARLDTHFIYLLGCLPFLQLPYDSNNNMVVCSGGTHAIIYSRSSRERALQDYQNITIDDWDSYNNFNINRFTYYEPLVYQIFTMTDNRKQWALPDFILNLAGFVIWLFKLDIQVEPGYSIFYAGSKAAFYILIGLLVVGFYGAYGLMRGKRRR